MTLAANHIRLHVTRADTMRRLALFGAILLSGGNLMIPRLPLAALVLLIGILFFGFVVPKVNTRKILVYTWLICVMTLAFLRFQHVDIIANMTRFSNFMIGLVLLRIYWDEGRHRLADDMRAVLLPLAYLSITTVVLAVVAPGLFVLIQDGPQRMYTFLGLFNYAVPVIEGPLAVRPIGFFWEPGVFSLHLNILLFVLFTQDARVKLIAFVFLTVLLTQSTSGIGIALLQGTYFFGATLFERRLKVRDAVMLTVALALAPVLYVVAADNFSQKFSGAMVGSLSARSFDLSIATQVIRENPVIGIGFSHYAYSEYAGSSSVDVSNLSIEDQDGRFNTNGIMTVLYSVGAPLGLIYVLAIYFQTLFAHRILFGTIIILALNSSPLALTPVFIFFAFNGLALPLRKRIVRTPRNKVSLPKLN